MFFNESLPCVEDTFLRQVLNEDADMPGTALAMLLCTCMFMKWTESRKVEIWHLRCPSAAACNAVVLGRVVQSPSRLYKDHRMFDMGMHSVTLKWPESC